MRIIKDKSGLYNLTWDKGNYILVGEDNLKVPMPDMPPEKEMINFGKRTKAQKFFRQSLPSNIGRWRKSDIEEMAAAQWHRRFNGEWWLIKGEPMYLPGPYLTFMEFWEMEKGGKPEFRTPTLELYHIWCNLIERDENCFGMFDMKARRIGDTENLLFLMWERGTRFRNSRIGLQSYTDNEAFKNFRRLAKGNRHMPFFFRPTHSGKDTHSLNFIPPSEVMTLKKIREKADVEESRDASEFLDSIIDYEATSTGKYDGERITGYHGDEYWKIKSHMMDQKQQWYNMKQCMSLNNEELILGKGAITSTIEEKKVAGSKAEHEATIQIAKYFWDNSDPNKKDEFGRTYTGLIRVMRGWEYSAKVDEWGYPILKKAKARRDAQIKAAKEAGDAKLLASIYRKQPSNAREALRTDSERNPLFPELCELRLDQIRDNVSRFGEPYDKFGKPITKKVVTYDLIWKNGQQFTEVIAVPKEGGKWHISQHPVIPNNVVKRGKFFLPRNMAAYRMGVDPYDANEIIGSGSDGAFAVKRMFNQLYEKNLLEFDEIGRVLNTEDLVTGQYVCDYKHRPTNPVNFYWDVVKTCWYWGIACFPELDKYRLAGWMLDKNLRHFIQYEPNQIINAKRKPRQGAKTTNDYIASYVEALQTYIERHIWCTHHPRIIEQWRDFQVEHRTHYDLAVSTGWTELACLERRYKSEEHESSSVWSMKPYRTYKN